MFGTAKDQKIQLKMNYCVNFKFRGGTHTYDMQLIIEGKQYTVEGVLYVQY
jgi:hypothetical protein